MKRNFFVLLALAILFVFSNGVAQHTLQIDNSGVYSIIKGSATGGTYTLGIGGGTILTTGSSIGNTNDNPIGGDNQGLGSNGLNWQVNGTGYVGTLSNLSAANNADGLQIAVASATGNGRALVVTTGTNFNPTGGAGIRNEVFRVMNDGSTTIGNGSQAIKNVYSNSTGIADITVNANSYVEYVPFTVTGAAVGDPVVLAANAAIMGAGDLIPTAYVNAPNTVIIRFTNPTGAAISYTGGSIRVVVTHF